MRALVAEAAAAARRAFRRYALLLLAYLAYTLVLQPIAQNPSAPAAAVFGAGACFNSSSSSSGSTVSGHVGLLFSALLWMCSLPVRLLGRLKADLCQELLGACQDGMWLAEDCTALFQQPDAGAT
jgi:hypothetical protein